MSRLEKKCFVASVALHSLLALILLVGPAFLSSRRKVPDLPVLKVIPARLVDEALFGGGNPNARPQPEQTVEQPPAQPQRQPDPVPPQTRPEPEPPKPSRQTVKQPDPEPPKIKVAETTVKPPPTRPSIKVSQNITKRQEETSAASKPQNRIEPRNDARERELARQQTAKRIDRLFDGVSRNLDKNLSSGTTVEMPGPGGEAYANYAQAVKSIYDRAWIDPEEVSEDDATVQVKVIISRDGTVVSDVIVRRSGVSPLDKSVQNALDRVSYIAPFPEGAKESQRTFIINFNLKSKRLAG